MDGAQSIAAERQRQIEGEGYNASHDDMATRYQLGIAALGYIMAATCAQRDIASSLPPPRHWPWDEKYWKPKDPRHNLVVAGALIAAEIDRIDRLAQTHSPDKAREDGNNA